MDISQINKDNSAQQTATYQKLAQHTQAPVSVPESKTYTAQAVQAVEKSGDSVQIKYSATSKNLDTVRAIEQMHARLNQLVKGVRETNEGLDRASDVTEQMQSELQQIVKNYPPFSADSPERQRILMSYVSIRKEMERLMVPPPPAPVYEKVQGMWESLFDGSGQIKSDQLPAVDSTSSDGKVKEASIMLDKVDEKLTALSDGITKALVMS